MYEVVSVGGKTLFSQYVKLLTACRVPYVIIADLDYTREIGSETYKSLFSVSPQAVRQNVVDVPTVLMERALWPAWMRDRAGSIDDLKALWEYVKSRQARLRTVSDRFRAKRARLVHPRAADSEVLHFVERCTRSLSPGRIQGQGPRVTHPACFRSGLMGPLAGGGQGRTTRDHNEHLTIIIVANA